MQKREPPEGNGRDATSAEGVEYLKPQTATASAVYNKPAGSTSHVSSKAGNGGEKGNEAEERSANQIWDGWKRNFARKKSLRSR